MSNVQEILSDARDKGGVFASHAIDPTGAFDYATIFLNGNAVTVARAMEGLIPLGFRVKSVNSQFINGTALHAAVQQLTVLLEKQG